MLTCQGKQSFSLKKKIEQKIGGNLQFQKRGWWPNVIDIHQNISFSCAQTPNPHPNAQWLCIACFLNLHNVAHFKNL